jgi:arylsulfatase A
MPLVAAAARPNILVVYADDLGYGDVACYNPQRGKISTPCIDALAAEGMRFTDAHSSSGVCSPSRYTLLTGRYHWRTRLQRGIVGTWEEPLIAADRLTIGGLAKRHGYRTAAIGKWHLGWEWPIDAARRGLVIGTMRRIPDTSTGEQRRFLPSDVTPAHREAWQAVFSRPIGGGPTTRGFDHYFGTDVPNWPPYCFIEDDHTLGIPATVLPEADFRNHRASKQGPAITDWKLEHVLPTLRDRGVAFIEEAAAAEEPFLLYMPLTSPHTPLAVNKPWRGASGLNNACADLIMETDAIVGDLLAAVERAGCAEETLVIFTSDNGFAHYVGGQQLERQGHFPSGPFRGYKGDAWEGGHRVAFIVRYPGVVAPGSVCDALVHQADIFATLADLLGESLPPQAGEDSLSLLPLLAGSGEPIRHHAVSCSASGVPAVRDGSWKLILGNPAWGGASGAPADLGNEVRLYDLAVDPGERENLASRHPERVAAMTAAYRRIVEEGRSTPGPRQPNDVDVAPYRSLPTSQESKSGP